MKKLTITLITVAILTSITLFALGPKVDKAKAIWDANTEVDLAGYYLYWKSIGGSYSDSSRVTNSVSSIPNFNLNTLSLAPGTYAIVVSAFNTAGNESGFSNEINWTNRIPASVNNVRIVQ